MSSLAANVRAVLQADFGTLGGGGPLNIQVLQYQICRGAFAVAQKLDDPELAPLRVELLCKLMLPPRREPLAFDKFILVVPFYVLWAFPLSFYARAHLQSTSSSSSAETKRCAQLMGRPKLCLRVDWQIKIPDAFNLVSFFFITLSLFFLFRSLALC